MSMCSNHRPIINVEVNECQEDTRTSYSTDLKALVTVFYGACFNDFADYFDQTDDDAENVFEDMAIKSSLSLFRTHFETTLQELQYPKTINISNIMKIVEPDLVQLLLASTNREKLKQASRIFQTSYNIKEEWESGKVFEDRHFKYALNNVLPSLLFKNKSSCDSEVHIEEHDQTIVCYLAGSVVYWLKKHFGKSPIEKTWCIQWLEDNSGRALPAQFAMRDRGSKLTVPTPQFVDMLMELEKSYRKIRTTTSVPKEKIVANIDKIKYFPEPNENVLSLAMLKYVRLRAHISTVTTMQRYSTNKRSKTNATRKKLQKTHH